MIVKRLERSMYYKGKGGFWNLINFLMSIGSLISDYSKHLLLILVFLFKFLEWWYSTEQQRTQQYTILIPPPPPPPKVSQHLFHRLTILSREPLGDMNYRKMQHYVLYVNRREELPL